MSDILSLYPQVAGDPRAMAVLAAALHQRGKSADAARLGLAAVEAAPGDTEIRDMVRVTLAAGVPFYHAPMLHDGPRNRCYAEAIARDVKSGMLVLEIGAGAGLLALLCARAGARVVTCEANPAMAVIAAEHIARNGLADRITLVPKRSTDLRIGTDLPERADMLVAEIFHDTYFGEGITPYYTDAVERLLKPGAPILPPRAEVRCALVETHRPPHRGPVGMVEGFDLSLVNLLANPRRERLGDKAELRSDPQSVLRMDYLSPPPFGPASETATLTATGGKVDAIAQWLRIDFGGGTVFENGPLVGRHSAWGTTVFPLPEPIDTKPGQHIAVTAHHEGLQLFLKAQA